MTSVQYQLPAKGGHFALVPVPMAPDLGPNEISIRTKAIGLNGLDWKNRAFGIMIQVWPAVLGVDASGIVQAVGNEVQGFQPGDEVFSLAGIEPKAGAFQEIFTVPAHFVAKKPSSLTFEEAASLPIISVTAAAAIAVGLHLPLPHLDPTGQSEHRLESILVLGGSSGVGAAAIQYLRLALPNARILTTSSAQHHKRLLSLGATRTFERTADISDIKAATPGGSGVDAILDSVAAASQQAAIFDALSHTGPKLYSQVMTGQNITPPKGVKGVVLFGRQIFGTKGGLAVITGLSQLIESGKFQLPTKVEVVGKGFDAIGPGLDRLMKGYISGNKFVVSI
ncbi:hypothetical protein N7448_004432 [Penicillium atrosanguineum]|uniref:Enoyl reductase (ER) domain-containing protein n=1 Tax=Penicillium atrosanguineum TaxID=1132637 RepID=A0A9W9Q179_9EURO|nr:uncharacterized protein N7443_003398 [Penicillium atrosanguineum]KAJ5117916.1 hypothetical protein N7526_010939 [Penicillium atrosanguineum]KAJ5141024.1 hypothetical protein N7448_004432 [Penicillium atrosanguineum]KAJ5310937.1 hypothetical protein N7443_003398 [Penicillium atrosanguineum]KAJ5316462.1 hypothetical protein N7476_006769 [Penicillium atrosanguineum]